MRRIVAVGSLGLLLGCPGLIVAEDDLPPLSPPSPAPSTAGASAEESPASVPSTRPGNASILVVPGVPTRGQVRTRSSLPALEPVGSDAPDGLPPLVGPNEMPESRPPARTTDPQAVPDANEGGRRLMLESVPRGDSDPAPPRVSPQPRDRFRVQATTPRRPSGLLGRWFGPPFATGRTPSGSNDSIVVEPRVDATEDAALKRRLERQIAESYGEHLRMVEVRVIGRNVTIHARAARFWQRRNLRRSLESLPGLSGFHSTIEVD